MKRIKYISKFSKEMTASEINQLTEAARKNNLQQDITGIFMTSGQIFFQIIEGPEKEVNNLWDSIAIDSRHTDIIILKTEKGSFDRLFPDWSMKGVVLDAESEMRLEPLKAIMEMIVEWEKRKEKLVNTIEFSIFSEMTRIESVKK